MTRRIEAGPLLVALGALLLLVSLFLDWYEPATTAWEAFEALDLLLAGLGLAALGAAVGALSPGSALVERHWLPPTVVLIAVVIASQLLDTPPAVDGDPDTGLWIALGAALVLAAGAVLTLGRVSFALTVEGRDTRRRVSAVDARTDPTTTEGPAVTAPTKPIGGTRTRKPDTPSES